MIRAFRRTQTQNRDPDEKTDPPIVPSENFQSAEKTTKEIPTPFEPKPEAVIEKPPAPVKEKPKLEYLLIIEKISDNQVKITFAGRPPVIMPVEKHWDIIRDYYKYKILPTDPEPAEYYKLKDNPGRPPKEWWNSMVRRLSREHPGYSGKRISKVAGGIWEGYSVNTKRRLTSRAEGKSRQQKRRS